MAGQQNRQVNNIGSSVREAINIINFLPDATFVINLDGQIIAWNKAIEVMSGVKAEEMLGKSDREYSMLFYNHRRPMLVDLILEPDAETEGQYVSCKRENEMLIAEGTLKVAYGSGKAHMWGQAAPLYDNEGKIVGAIESFRDITDFKRTENAYRDSQRRLADIIDFLPDATFAINLDGEVIAWNKAIEVMTGVKADAILGKKGYSTFFYGMERPMLINMVIKPDPDTEDRYSIFKRKGGLLIAEGFVNVAYGNGISYNWGQASCLYDSDGNLCGAIESFRDITEKKQKESALRSSERRFADIISFLPDATYAIDKGGKVIAWNRAIEKMTGVKASEIIGKGYQEYSVPFYGEKRHMLSDLIFNPDPELKNSYPNLIEENGIYIADAELPVAYSEQKASLWGRAAPLYDEKGNLVGAIESFRDISVTKRLENSLRQSEQRLSDIINFLPDATFVVDLEGRVISWNKAIEEMTGIKAEEMLGKGEKEYSIPFHGEKKPLLIDQALDSEIKRDDPLYLINRDGSMLTVEYEAPFLKGPGTFLWAKATPLYDSLGNVLGAIESVRDITTWKELEESLREQKELLQVTLSSIGDAVITTDSKEYVTFVNPVAEKLTGYTLSEAVGRPIREIFNIINEETRQPVEIPTDRVLREGVIVGLANHTVLIAKDETERSISDSAAPIKNNKGNILGVVLVFRDVTESRVANEQLKYLSFHDQLTGLYNRALFEAEMKRISSDRFAPLGMIICDIDGLKLINDSFGHSMGDSVLISAAEILKQSFRSSDVVARIGGDEFAVLLPNTTREAVEEGYQRVIKLVKKNNFDNPQLPLNISVGYAIDYEDVNAAELFKEADNNMYREKLHRSHSTRSAIVQTLMRTLEARDIITQAHSDRLQHAAVALAREVQLPKRALNDIRLLAQFHDIGKVGIPDRILLKPGSLTPEEKSEMQRHCEIGYRIALSAPDLVPIADWILRHHEWWNGKGYPLNLKEEEIPLECRILAIADAYEAMTSDRPYRKAMSQEEMVEELERYAGIQFDPLLTRKFVSMVKQYI